MYEIEIEFGIGSVPIKVAARVYGKSPSWVREGIISGLLPIGFATGEGQRKNYYISPKLLYEHTGFVWKGEQQ